MHRAKIKIRIFLSNTFTATDNYAVFATRSDQELVQTNTIIGQP